MSFAFQKASKKSARLRMALIGVAGSGKTYTALNIAQHLGGPVAVVDTERGSASKYSDIFEFDVLELETFAPQTYIDAIKAAEEAGYNVLIIDSLSHAWTGKEGALDQVTRATKRSQSGNTFAAWRDVTPLHNQMVDAIISARLHIIATMRSKTEYVQEKNDKTGKISVRKVGMAPIQRDGLEYEFDVVADLDQDNNLIVSKTRCPAIAGAVFPRAGKDIAQKLSTWLTDGALVESFKAAAPPQASRQHTVERAVRPVETRTAETIHESDDLHDALDDVDVVRCHCGIEARYVRGKSGNGWVCGHQGTGAPACDFRLKDNPAEMATGAVAEDGETGLYEGAETPAWTGRIPSEREPATLNGHHHN